MRSRALLSTLTVGFLSLTAPTASAATGDDPADTCVLAADVDENGTVDIRDYMGVLSAYGTSDVTYDTDGDGLVGSRDLTDVLRSYGSSVDDACRGIWLPKNYHLSIQGTPMNLETGEVNFILQAAWRNSIRNMELCWAPSEVSNGDICDADAGGNEISITNGQGDDQPWVTEIEGLFPGTNRTPHTISMVPDTLAAQGFEPLQCGVEYRFRLHNGVWFDDVVGERSCSGWDDAETESEPCTECPYGGFYDNANCFIDEAPAGTTATFHAGLNAWAYIPGADGCVVGDVLLRDGTCLYDYVPEGAEGFSYGPTNAFYTLPSCE